MFDEIDWWDADPIQKADIVSCLKKPIVYIGCDMGVSENRKHP